MVSATAVHSKVGLVGTLPAPSAGATKVVVLGEVLLNTNSTVVVWVVVGDMPTTSMAYVPAVAPVVPTVIVLVKGGAWLLTLKETMFGGVGCPAVLKTTFVLKPEKDATSIV